MDLTYKNIDNKDSFEAFRTLLRNSNLPADDLDFERDLLIGYYEGNALVGTGGLEVHGDYALLRSLSVKMGIRGKSVGSTIFQSLLSNAKVKNLKAIYLLTETAKGFFEKKGFKEISRAEVPAAVKASSEFTSVCPSTATVMVLSLES